MLRSLPILLSSLAACLLTGCYLDDPNRPLFVDASNGVHVDVLERTAQTCEVTTPLATIVATRNGTVWEISVLSRSPDTASDSYRRPHYDSHGATTCKLTANDGRPHRVVTVHEGLVTLAYARTGWATSEVRVTVTNATGDIVHTVTLK